MLDMQILLTVAVAMALVNVKTSGERRTNRRELTSETDEFKNATADSSWMVPAILNVAYFARRHKFAGNDDRYQNGKSTSMFYKQFPDPPLKNVHWQVRRHCDQSFEICLKYISDSLSEAGFSLTRQNNPYMSKEKGNRQMKEQVCRKLLEHDKHNFQIFRDPLERFQWLVSISYYMCSYTLQKVPALKHFGENCDNWAGCADEGGVFPTEDIRARDSEPFACAFYSFCPDPCCSNRLLKTNSICLEGACDSDSPCEVNFDENSDWESMLLNYWNVSCTCSLQGTRWSSQSGLCIDIDECLEGTDHCNRKTESCMNVYRGYHCVCVFGYKRNANGPCEVDDFVQSLIYPTAPPEIMEESWVDKFQGWIRKV